MFQEVPFAELDEEIETLKTRAPVPAQVKLGAVRAQKPYQRAEARRRSAVEEGCSVRAFARGAYGTGPRGLAREKLVKMRSGTMRASRTAAPLREGYFEFTYKCYAICGPLGRTCLAPPRMATTLVVWRLKEQRGDVMRYIEYADWEGAFIVVSIVSGRRMGGLGGSRR